MFYSEQNNEVRTSRFWLKNTCNNVVNDNIFFKSMYALLD